MTMRLLLSGTLFILIAHENTLAETVQNKAPCVSVGYINYIVISLRNNTDRSEFARLLRRYTQISCEPAEHRFHFRAELREISETDDLVETIENWLNDSRIFEELYNSSLSDSDQPLQAGKELQTFYTINQAIQSDNDDGYTLLQKKLVILLSNYISLDLPSGTMFPMSSRKNSETYVLMGDRGQVAQCKVVYREGHWIDRCSSIDDDNAIDCSSIEIGYRIFDDYKTTENNLFLLAQNSAITLDNAVKLVEIVLQQLVNGDLCGTNSTHMNVEYLNVYYSAYWPSKDSEQWHQFQLPWFANGTVHFGRTCAKQIFSNRNATIGSIVTSRSEKTQRWDDMTCAEDQMLLFETIRTTVDRIGTGKIFGFTILVTDFLPNCFVSEVTSTQGSFNFAKSNLDIFVMDSVNKDDLYKNVTALLFGKDAENRANHAMVSSMNDFEENIIETGICHFNTSSINLIPSKPVLFHPTTTGKDDSTASHHDSSAPLKHVNWVAVSMGTLIAIVVLTTGIILTVWIYRRRQRERSEKVKEIVVPPVVDYAEPDKFSIELDRKMMRPWQIESKMLHVDYNNMLGKGANAIVYQAHMIGPAPGARKVSTVDALRFHDCSVAIKIPASASLIHGEQHKQLLREIEAMKRLEYHPMIITMLGWTMLEGNECLVVELAHTDLLKYLNSLRTNLTEVDKRKFISFAWQICSGMSHVASHNLVHRDLAARNIMLTSNLMVKIGDFGLCSDCDENLTYSAITTRKLPIKWLAPENASENVFSEKSDVWAFGVVLYEIYSLGGPPYPNLPNDAVIAHIRQGNRMHRPEHCPQNIYTIMSECWNAERALRPTFVELCDQFGAFVEEVAGNYGYITASLLAASYQ